MHAQVDIPIFVGRRVAPQSRNERRARLGDVKPPQSPGGVRRRLVSVAVVRQAGADVHPIAPPAPTPAAAPTTARGSRRPWRGVVIGRIIRRVVRRRPRPRRKGGVMRHRRRRRAEGDDGETYRVRAPARASPPHALRTADARVVVADGMRTGEVDPFAVRPDVVVVDIVVAAHVG